MLDTLGNLERTHTCGELRAENVGEQVVLMGWTAKKRDFGVFTFIDLRDRYGLTQVVVSEETAKEAHAKAKNVRGEFVIAVKGEVFLRDEGTRNAKLATGEIEVHVSEILILNDAKTLPFELEKAGSQNLASEDLRLKYRYLDLRRPTFAEKFDDACRRLCGKFAILWTRRIFSKSKRRFCSNQRPKAREILSFRRAFTPENFSRCRNRRRF